MKKLKTRSSYVISENNIEALKTAGMFDSKKIRYILETFATENHKVAELKILEENLDDVILELDVKINDTNIRIMELQKMEGEK